MPVTGDDLERDYRELEENFKKFREFRGADGLWDEAIRRNLENKVAPELSPYQEGIDFQSPLLEKALFDYKGILTMNPTRFDFYVYGEGQTYRDKERKILLTWTRAWNGTMNFGRRYDAFNSEGQTKHGLSVPWLRYHAKTGEASQKWPFYIERTVVDALAFSLPGLDGEVDATFYKYAVPVIGCGVLNENGETVTLDDMGKIGWLGAGEKHDTNTTRGKKIEVLIRDARRLDGEMCPACEGTPEAHVMREIAVYVMPENSNVKDAILANVTDSPFPWNSLNPVAANEQLTESDPHYRYRPMLAALYYLQLWQNYLMTTLATLARAEGGDEVGINVGSSNPETLAALGYNAEGGAKMVWDVPKPGPNQIPLWPGEPRRWPRQTSQYLMDLINLIEKLKQAAMPNRFLTGEAYSEASNATGTAFLAGLQQAGVPFDAPLTNTDASIYRMAMMCFHAIKYWAVTEPEGAPTEWTVAMSTAEHKNVMRYGDTIRPGETMSINAKDLDCDFDLVLKTENLSEAQRQAIWLSAKDKYFTGFYTPEDVWRDIGIMDIEGQKEKVFTAKVSGGLEPLFIQIAAALAIKQVSELQGYDIRSYIQSLQPEAPAGGAPSQQVPPQGNNPGSENNIIVPPNAQMGRSAQQLAYTVGINQNGPSGGTSGTQA